MYNYLFINRLQPISVLFEKRMAAYYDLLALIESKGLENVPYAQTLKFLKKKVLLSPAETHKPYVDILNATAKQSRPRYRVYYPFYGTRELMGYLPAGGPPTGNSQMIFQPVCGKLFIDFLMSEKNKDKAITFAEEQMDTTYDLLRKINREAQEWNSNMEAFLNNVTALYSAGM